MGGKKEPENFTEFQELARSAGAVPVALITGSRDAPDAKYFVGSGKADEIRAAVATTQAGLVLFNHALTPSQERNLESLLKSRVIDRTGLILDIFAQRARSFEGKLQVELAQLQHLATRLVRGWTHLERQKGGIGLRGPGETQLESDRRLVKSRIKIIKKRLEKVRSQRDQSRRARRRAEIPTVSLVGYTNAGKSTLFNRLTAARVYAADLPFATLDPTLRKIKLPEIGTVILADTVGFIRQLPHDLVEAFQGTLEETKQADLLLNVVDAHDPRHKDYHDAVMAVLEQIDAHGVPQLQVYNKVDLLPGYEERIDRDPLGQPWRVWVSAETGVGIELLQQALIELLHEGVLRCSLQLTPDEGKLRAALYELGAVLSEQALEDGGWRLSICLPQNDYDVLFP